MQRSSAATVSDGLTLKWMRAPWRPSFPVRNSSGLAIGSLVCSLFWMYSIGSIIAVILGYLAVREIRRDPAHLEGKGLAIAGIIVGWLGVAGMLLLVAFGVYI
jgi:hypothetical protein